MLPFFSCLRRARVAPWCWVSAKVVHLQWELRKSSSIHDLFVAPLSLFGVQCAAALSLVQSLTCVKRQYPQKTQGYKYVQDSLLRFIVFFQVHANRYKYPQNKKRMGPLLRNTLFWKWGREIPWNSIAFKVQRKFWRGLWRGMWPTLRWWWRKKKVNDWDWCPSIFFLGGILARAPLLLGGHETLKTWQEFKRPVHSMHIVWSPFLDPKSSPELNRISFVLTGICDKSVRGLCFSVVKRKKFSFKIRILLVKINSQLSSFFWQISKLSNHFMPW